MIDPAAITLVQSTFLNHINDAFALVVKYALDLLYIFAALEIVFTGFAWALQQDVVWGRALLKILKIGLIVFIIQNYPELINAIVRSFADLGGVIANTKNLSAVIFNPSKLWLYGYDNGLLLLKAAADGSSFGLSLLQIILGMGILFVFGLLGIQVVLQIVSFYFVSLLSLILLPFGAFNPSANLFERAMQSILQAGARVMVIITVVGMAVTVWSGFQLTPLTEPFNINAPLGLFFTGLLFLFFAIYLPKLASRAIGEISIRFSGNPMVTMVQGAPTATETAMLKTELSSVHEATSIGPEATTGGPAAASASTPVIVASSIAQAATPPASQAGLTSRVGAIAEGGARGLADAGRLERSISETTAKQIKKTFLQTLEEQELKETTTE